MANYQIAKKPMKTSGKFGIAVDTWSENQAYLCYRVLLDSCKNIARVKGKSYVGIYSGILGIQSGKHIFFNRQMTKERVEIL